MALLEDALLTARTLSELPFELNIWQAQNIWYDTLKTSRKEARSAEWQERFHELGRQMRIRVEELVVEEDEDAQKLAKAMVAG